VIVIPKQEGQAEQVRLRNESGQLRRCGNGHVNGAKLHAFNQIILIAEDRVGEQLDLDLTARLPLDDFGELLNAEAVGVFGGGHRPALQRPFGSSKSTCSDANQERNDDANGKAGLPHFLILL
jgi:hypothetical protein